MRGGPFCLFTSTQEPRRVEQPPKQAVKVGENTWNRGNRPRKWDLECYFTLGVSRWWRTAHIDVFS